MLSVSESIGLRTRNFVIWKAVCRSQRNAFQMLKIKIKELRSIIPFASRAMCVGGTEPKLMIQLKNVPQELNVSESFGLRT